MAEAGFGGQSFPASITTIDPESGLPVLQNQPTTTTVTPSGNTVDPESGAPVTSNTAGAITQPNNPQSTVSVSGDARERQQDVQKTPTAGNEVASSPQSMSDPAPAAPSKDMRLRLSALDPSIFTGILAPLKSTNGMLFPYTPQIAYNQSVTYMDLQLVHSNTDYPAYTRTPSLNITINGKFSVQSQGEGKYALAALHFLRAASKSHFGESDPNAGLPPPILTLDGYGQYMFKRLRVILKSHSWTFDENIDTISVNAGNGLVRLPALFTISCELMVVQTPARMRTKFNFSQFASGQLMEQQEGWI